MSTTTKPVKLLNTTGRTEAGSVSYSTRPPWCVEVRSSSIPPIRRCAADLFACLREIRLVLEPLGWRVLVNGARVDACVSGMAAGAGGGKVYIFDGPAGRPSLVLTFDEAPAEKIATVAEQESRYRQLLKSQGIEV